MMGRLCDRAPSNGVDMVDIEKGIKAYSREGLIEFIQNSGFPTFRAKQIEQWLYQKGAKSYDSMTNLSKDMRVRLASEAPLYCAEIDDRQISKDGTRKYIVRYADGKTAEMVAMPTDNRLTVCASSQVGCAMACSFCATGKEGFSRNLLPGEIVEQVLLAQEDMGMRVSNVVVMGQGEPFQNYGNTLAALRFLNGKDGLNIGARHMTVSTCGITDGIQAFGAEPEQFVLAISLHSAIQETRDALMPRMKNQTLPKLHDAIEAYQADCGRRVSLEYLLIDGFNDDDEHLDSLVEFCQDIQAHVNLLPLNNVPGSPFKPAGKHRVERFIRTLERAGVEATMRDSRGGDIAAACGQLKNQKHAE